MKKTATICCIAITLLCVTAVYGQSRSDDSMIAGKVWAAVLYEIAHYEEGSVIRLHQVKNREEVNGLYGWGVMFHDNGTFEELLNRRCAFDRQPHVAQWISKSDTLIVDIDSCTKWNFKVYSASKDELRVSYSVKRE